ncbi:MAG: DNA polymerase subunit beta, partial [Candidatus Freyarchaeota archaeon]|nr:DNA polymerase subunit beta [Candidatus Jordarchaeia archaeon]
MSYDEFARSERRKHMSGLVMGYDFFLRFVKLPDEYGESYGERVYKPLGRALVEGVVLDDSDAIFTPCRYLLGNVNVLDGVKKPVREVFSLRGRFSDQAREGERVLARGKVEAVYSEEDKYFRLVIGGERSDFIIVKG